MYTSCRSIKADTAQILLVHAWYLQVHTQVRKGPEWGTQNQGGWGVHFTIICCVLFSIRWRDCVYTCPVSTCSQVFRRGVTWGLRGGYMGVYRLYHIPYLSTRFQKGGMAPGYLAAACWQWLTRSTTGELSSPWDGKLHIHARLSVFAAV